MTREFLLAVALLIPNLAVAQEAGTMDHSTVDHSAMDHNVVNNSTMDHTTMDHSTMDHGAMMNLADTELREGGQAGFAAIAEVVALLSADPMTDWTQVNIETLRQHLIDMDNVTLRAVVDSQPTQTGAVFVVTSDAAAVQRSIRRMVLAHAATMDGVNGWRLTASESANGATLDVSGSAGDAARIQGLGFIGIMTIGMHHQTHHLALASGQDPHR